MNERKSTVILIGFMGSGKSTTGICLSHKLRCPFDDTDKMIEKNEKKSIPEIFAESGEAYFRDRETQLLRELAKKKTERILSVGGGTPLRVENRKLLHEIGTVVYLKVSAQTVYERLKGDTGRPLLQGDNPMERIKSLLAEREKIYRSAADIIIAVDEKSQTQAADEIAALLERKKA